MGWDEEMLKALRRVASHAPELLREMARHGVALEDHRLVSPLRPELVARIKQRLGAMPQPNFRDAVARIKEVLRHEIREMTRPADALPSPSPSPSVPETAADVPPAPADALPLPPPPVPPPPAEWQRREPDEPWLPPALEAPLGPLLEGFHYEHYREICEESLPGWRVLAGTRRGRLHAHHGTFREDAFAHGGDRARGRFWVYCVCDGAGSSRLSRIGSEATGRWLVRELTTVLGEHYDAWTKLSAEAFNQALSEAIVGAVRGNVAFLDGLAKDADADGRDFRTTLLLAILYRHGDKEVVSLSQVGDGFVAFLNRQGNARRLGTASASGDFSGEVKCFVPDEGSAELARPFGVIPSTENLRALALCTDGIEDPFYPVEANVGALFAGLVDGGESVPVPGLHWPQAPDGPAASANSAQARERLARWLAFEKKGENDDRTVLLIYKVGTGYPGETRPSL